MQKEAERGAAWPQRHRWGKLSADPSVLGPRTLGLFDCCTLGSSEWLLYLPSKSLCCLISLEAISIPYNQTTPETCQVRLYSNMEKCLSHKMKGIKLYIVCVSF